MTGEIQKMAVYRGLCERVTTRKTRLKALQNLYSRVRFPVAPPNEIPHSTKGLRDFAIQY